MFEKRRRAIGPDDGNFTTGMENPITTGVGEEYDRPGAYECECTCVHDARLLVYPHHPRPIEKQMKTAK